MPAIKSNAKREHLVHVLSVDDNAENLAAIEAILASPRYKICSVTSGREALQQITQQDFALILMDVQMPDMDGFETAWLIKARLKSRQIPIIFITAINRAMEHVERGYAVGATDYIFKPFNPQTLRLKVEALIDYQAYYDEVETQSGLLQQKTRELEAAYNQLNFVNNNLERMVEERTRELLLTNCELQREIEEHKLTKEHFRRLFALSPNLMSVRSLPEGGLVDVNHCWLELTGYERADLSSLMDLYTPEPDSLYKGRLELQGDLRNLKVGFQTKSGQARHGLLSTEQLDVGGQRLILSVVTDVTELVNLQKEMRRLDRLNLVGEMAASIGHEIRNPMTAVRGFLQLLAHEDNSGNKVYYELMISELDRANDIISVFLNLAGNKSVELRPNSLNDLIHTIYPLLSAEVLHGDKNLVMELGPVDPVLLDEKEIRQLIVNLCHNGLESMPAGGALSIKTWQQGDEVILMVSDQGAGIDDDLMERIGTPFVTTKPEGTGLGLPVCFSIAHRHRARIEIQTGEAGTSISVIFPAHQNYAAFQYMDKAIWHPNHN
jgi:PAS domain S-box-containing protein